MQYCIINNDIALLMHYRALLQMPDLQILKPIFLGFRPSNQQILRKSFELKGLKPKKKLDLFVNNIVGC